MKAVPSTERREVESDHAANSKQKGCKHPWRNVDRACDREPRYRNSDRKKTEPTKRSFRREGARSDMHREQHERTQCRQQYTCTQTDRQPQLQLEQLVSDALPALVQRRPPALARAQPGQQIDGERDHVQLHETNEDKTIHQAVARNDSEQECE